MTAPARIAISGATDISAVNGNSFVPAALSGHDGDNGQLGVVVSDNTKDRARATASR